MGVFAPLNSVRSGVAAVATDSSLSLHPLPRWPSLVQSIAYRQRDRLVGIIAIPGRVRGHTSTMFAEKKKQGYNYTVKHSEKFRFAKRSARFEITMHRCRAAID